jgi:hypothetical protein
VERRTRKGKGRKAKGVHFYLSSGTFSSETLDLAISVDLVVLEYGELGLLALMLDLLWGRVDLLLTLLGAATEAEHEVQG